MANTYLYVVFELHFVTLVRFLNGCLGLMDYTPLVIESGW